jgi:hypothetical protein
LQTWKNNFRNKKELSQKYKYNI